VNRKNFAVLQNNWGYHYYKKGDYDGAAEAFKKALEQNPENQVYRKNLGLALAGAGREEEAAQIMKEGLR